VSLKIKKQLESELVNKKVEIENLNSTQQKLTNQLVEISELKKECFEERDSLITVLSNINAQLDTLLKVNSNSLLDYYWSSIENIEQKIIKRTYSFADGKQELGYWKIKKTKGNRLVYEQYDSSKNLISVTEEVLTDSVVYFLNIKNSNNIPIYTFEKNTAFIGYEGVFQTKYSYTDMQSEPSLKFFYIQENQVVRDKIKINNQTYDCVKFIVSVSILDNNNNEIDKLIQTNYLLKNKGIVYAEKEFLNSPAKNCTINSEIIELSEF
jgi:hypothetical protein